VGGGKGWKRSPVVKRRGEAVIKLAAISRSRHSEGGQIAIRSKTKRRRRRRKE